MYYYTIITDVVTTYSTITGLKSRCIGGSIGETTIE